MAQCEQQPTHPRRMRADFHADSTAAHRTKHLGHRFLAGADVGFLNHLACFVQNAVVARAISQIQTNRELVLIENLASASSHSAKLFHSRLPFPCASSALMISSVMPSTKYSCSASGLRSGRAGADPSPGSAG